MRVGVSLRESMSLWGEYGGLSWINISIWVSMGFYENLWINVNIRVFMNINGSLCMSMGVYGVYESI